MSEKWKIAYEHQLDDGATLEVGDTFALRGERGKRYRYIKTVHNIDRDDTWIDCYGGSRGGQQFRSIPSERLMGAEKKK